MNPAFLIGASIRWLKMKAGGAFPLYVQWELTERCNLNCLFCTASNQNRWQPELKYDEVIERIDQFAALGTVAIHYSGGEPSLYPRIDEVIAHTRLRGIHTGVTTNGATPLEKQKLLLGAPMHRISLDGLKERHDRLRGRGTFDRVMETVAMMKRHGRRPAVSMMVDKTLGEEELEAFIGFCDERDILVNLHKLSYTSHQLREEGDIRPNEYQRRHLIEDRKFIGLVGRMRRKWGRRILYPRPYLTIMAAGGLKHFGCRVFDVALGLKPDGTISIPCNEYPLETLKVMPREFYEGGMHKKYRGRVGQYPFCEFCNCRCMGTASALAKVRTTAETALSVLYSTDIRLPWQ